MKVINGKKYLKIGEVAKILERTPQTIRNWYGWAEMRGQADLLPPTYAFDNRGTRFFNEDDIPQLREFERQIKYGSLAEFNRQLWGTRGRKIK